MTLISMALIAMALIAMALIAMALIMIVKLHDLETPHSFSGNGYFKTLCIYDDRSA